MTKVVDLPISVRGPSSTPPRRGDLAVQLSGGELTVPHRLGETLRASQVHSLADLLELLDTFPTQVAHDLHWDVEEVREARERIVREFGAYMNPQLVTHASPRRVFGVRGTAEDELNTRIRRRRPT